MPWPPGSSLVGNQIVVTLKRSFELLADAKNGSAMSAYMRNQFPFHGIPSPLRKSAIKIVLEECGFPEDVFAVASQLWELPEREYQLTAVELLHKAVSRKRDPVQYSVEHVAKVVRLITTKSWWDTVDGLAPKVLGPMLLGRSELQEMTQSWIASGNIWLQRSAIIVQLHFKQKTNPELLFSLILQRGNSKEVFVRKGAGWALREYSKTNPTLVRTFIDDNLELLSPLTIREGGKYC